MDTLERHIEMIGLASEIKKRINPAELTKLNETQRNELVNAYYFYTKLKKSMEQGKEFHKEKCEKYNLPYLLNEVKRGRNHLEIINQIINKCHDYSKKKISAKYPGAKILSQLADSLARL